MKFPKNNWALKGFLMSSVVLGPFAISAGAMAQDNNSEEQEALEEVIVTATKRETNLMDTPVAISAFNEDHLDQLGIKNIKDLNNLVPNMSIMVDVESSAPIITMRGIRSSNTTEWGDPAVGVHLDGIYSPRPQGALALMFDIERAEILRGPQGTLFGRNSTVGSVNVISKKPEFGVFSGKGSIEYGRWNQRSIKAAVNLPGNDTFAFRMAAMVEKRDSNVTGYWDPNQWDQRYLKEMGLTFTPSATANTPAANDWSNRNFFRDQLYEEIPVTDQSNFYNNINQWALRMSGYWKPSDKMSWLVTLERYRDDNAGGVNTRDCARIEDRPVTDNGGSCTDIWGSEDNFVAYVNVPGKNDMTMDSVRSNFNWDFYDGVSLVYNMGFQSQERSGQIDLDQGWYFWDQMLKWVDTDYDSWSHEIQFQSNNPDAKMQWIAGYFNFKETNFMNGQYFAGMGGASSWQQPERTVKSEAIFGQATYELNEKLFFTFGARHTSDRKQDVGGRNYGCWWGNDECYVSAWDNFWKDEYADWSANFGTDAAIPQTSKIRNLLNVLPSNYYDIPSSPPWGIDTSNDVTAEWSKTTWRVGLDYDVDDDTMIYASAANGYKSGGVGDVIYLISDPTKKFDTSYEAESVVTYEAGIKTKALDGTMNLRANIFYSDYTNQQFTAWTIFDAITVQVPNPENPAEMIEETQELGTFLTRNAAGSKIKGLELEMEWNAWKGGHIGGYVTFLDAKLNEDYWKLWGGEAAQVFAGYDPNNATQQLLDLDDPYPWFRNLNGNTLPYSPKMSLTINISHDFTLPNGGTLTPFLNYHYESSSYVDIDNRDKWNIPAGALNDVDPNVYTDKRNAWGLATFNLTYRSPNEAWYAEAYVYNLTNADVNWWQGYSGNTPSAAKARQTYGVRLGMDF